MRAVHGRASCIPANFRWTAGRPGDRSTSQPRHSLLRSARQDSISHTEQSFERGYVFWLSDEGAYYVLARDTASWKSYPERASENAPFVHSSTIYHLRMPRTRRHGHNALVGAGEGFPRSVERLAGTSPVSSPSARKRRSSNVALSCGSTIARYLCRTPRERGKSF